MRVLVLLVLIALTAPAALTQKPPAPAPPPANPSSGSSGNTINPINGPTTQPGQPLDDLVLFLRGRVATSDGTLLPSNVVVERVCNISVRQQVYTTSHGDFSMQLGSMADSFVDATGTGSSPQQDRSISRAVGGGIPRRELIDCELRASASGFRSSVVSLAALSPSEQNVDVGQIVVERTAKVKGTKLSARPYQAPKDARSEYEKGVQAEKEKDLASARQHFEAAVKTYPKYESAWYELGGVLRKQKQVEAARAAYTRAIAIDVKFMPPYLSLASMAFDVRDWPELLKLSNHVLGTDSLDYAKVRGYVLDLDSLDYAEAYFYNAVANYQLHKVDEAEKSGIQAERLDMRPRFPQLHLLLAEIHIGKNNYPAAIAELRIYLDMMPKGREADQAREELVKLESIGSPSTEQKNN